METVRLYHRIDELRRALASARREGRPVGLVPTMGALHRGHESLIRRSAIGQRPEQGLTVVSIFVNPIQFENKADLDRYPHTLSADLALCAEAGADIVFAPSAAEMYPEGFSTFVDMEGGCTDRFCGRARPGHFRGVLTVVSKLFHIVEPTRAYFGEKDAQQLFLLKKMARDLNMNIEIIGCPTMREADGLALSSRNERLSPEERTAARCLVRALEAGRAALEARATTGCNAPGDRAAALITAAKASMTAVIAAEPLARLDYAEVLDAETFGPPGDATAKALLAVAAYIGETRLIDNASVDVNFWK